MAVLHPFFRQHSVPRLEAEWQRLPAHVPHAPASWCPPETFRRRWTQPAVQWDLPPSRAQPRPSHPVACDFRLGPDGTFGHGPLGPGFAPRRIEPFPRLEGPERLERPERARAVSEGPQRFVVRELEPQRVRSEVTATLDLLSACALKPPAGHAAVAQALLAVSQPELCKAPVEVAQTLEAAPPTPGPSPWSGSTTPSPKKSPSDTRSLRLSPSSSAGFPGSFVLRRKSAEEDSNMRPKMEHFAGHSATHGRMARLRPQQQQACKVGRGLSEPGTNADGTSQPTSPDVCDKLSPVPHSLSPPLSAPFSPDDLGFAPRACRADAGTQTGTPQGRQHWQHQLLAGTPPQSARQKQPLRTLQDEWNMRNLPACISALAVKEEEPEQQHCLRKLEVRVAPCWRNDRSLKSDTSSLQVSSTQSPSSFSADVFSGDGGDQGNKRHSLADSFSSLSSPLDLSSTWKELETSPLAEEVGKLPLEELQKRAETLTQKLQRRERQCLALREALESCNSQFRHALGGSPTMFCTKASETWDR
ncbi:unnamed protein product [Effrenium voratum]|nr:unnamed protein product [Effrenium voratum]